VTAFRALDQFDVNRSFGAWLFAIARNKFLDHCRSRRSTTDEIPETPDLRTPHVILEESEGLKGVWQWVRGCLTEEQFLAVWLFYQEEMSVRDIAVALGRTPISVKVILFRARRRLVRARAMRAAGNFVEISPLAGQKPQPNPTLR
jgi:RNA polymerase sigma-70 factor (ECF subfamily)